MSSRVFELTRVVCRSAIVVSLGLGAAAPVAGAGFGDELFILHPADLYTGDFFGYAVAVSGSRAIVGSWQDDAAAAGNCGSAYIYDVETGQNAFKIFAADRAGQDHFGMAVGLDGNTAIVGAPHRDETGADSGAAYLFDVATGAQLFKLLPSDGAGSDMFGAAVAVHGTVAVVGADRHDAQAQDSGAVYVFDLATGTQITELLPSSVSAYQHFGTSVAITGEPGSEIVVVGAPRAFFDGTFAYGGAFVFDAHTGAELFALRQSDPQIWHEFGWAVAADGNVALVSAYHDDDVAGNAGAAYFFDLTTGQQLAKVVPPSANMADQFGYAVSMSGGTAIISANMAESIAIDAGIAYLFDVSTFDLLGSIVGSNTAYNDWFGESVSISGDRAIVGTSRSSAYELTAGAAYIFDVGRCTPDLTGDGVLDFFDVAAFLDAFSAGDSVADFTGDGVFDFFDVAAFLDAFSGGCP
jgi:FG-GAP repeat